MQISTFYLLGLLCGAAVGVIVFLIAQKQHPSKFDERQILGQGTAYRVGFFTMMIGEGLCAGLEVAGILPGEPVLWHIGVLCVGIGAFAVTAIHLDAYVSLNETLRQKCIAGGVLFVCMVWHAVYNLNLGKEMISIICLFVAGLWLVVIAALLIHNRRKKPEEEE